MKKSRIVVLFMLILLILVPTFSFAAIEELTLNITADNKEEISKDDIINVKVSWKEKMQAADFDLNYNSKKLDFIKSDIDEKFINNKKEEGVIKTSWASLDETDKTNITYTFKVKKTGKFKFSTNIGNGEFATGNLEIPKKYNEGKLTIGKDNYFVIILIILVVIIVITVIINLIIKIKNRKNKDTKENKK